MSVTQHSVFIGQDSRTGGDGARYGLWGSDGSTAGELDAFSATAVEPTSSVISTAASLPGSLVFAVPHAPGGVLFATDPASGRPVELAVAGLPIDDAPSGMTRVGDAVLFAAGDDLRTSRLWRTDGTAAGTAPLAIPAAPGGINATEITAFGVGALFLGSGADGFNDIFFTDGTAAGTREIAAFATPVPSPNPFGLLPQIPIEYFDPLGSVGGREVFVGPGGGTSLWSTDGTAAGTTPVAAIPFASDLNSYGSLSYSSATIGGRIVYGQGGVLSVTDGTASGSSALVDFTAQAGVLGSAEVYGLTTIGSRAVFGVYDQGDHSDDSASLYVTDGTTAGTAELDVPVLSGGLPAGLDPGDLTAFGSRVLFTGRDAGGGSVSPVGLWITDGTVAGTVEIGAGLDPTGITALAGGTAEFASGGALYVTDGTAAGTRPVASPGAASVGLAPNTIQAVPSPLVFSGPQGQYAIAPTAAGALQVRDLAGGAATGPVPDARVVDFADGSAAVFDASGNAGAIARIYLAAYGAAPDESGLLAYTAQADAGTVTLAQIAAAAPGSPQFLAMNAGLSDARFVTLLYRNADGRAPDAGGLAGYTAALAGGQTRGQVLLAIAESPEARLHSLALAGQADDAAVTRLYTAIDGRAPDAGGKIAYAGALDAGRSVQQVAAAMLASPEYAARFGAPGDAAFVTELYGNLLGRAPDPAGLAGYTAALAGGESRAALVAGIVGSDEARLATAPLTHEGYVSLG